ncbi:MAG: hypothetical protein ABIG03_02295 [Candidatus Eisenbacteria bacterium]
MVRSADTPGRLADRLSGATSQPGQPDVSHCVLLLLAALILLPSCGRHSPDGPDYDLPSLPIASRGYEVGIAGLVARNDPDPSDQDFLDFLDELSLVGERSGVYVAWDDPHSVDDQVELVTTYSAVAALAGVGFNIDDVDATYFETHGDDLLNVALALVGEFDLDYLAVGIEVNSVRDKCSQEAFDDFVVLYGDIYDAVKAASPGTKVFTVFQLDCLRGAARLTGLDLEPSWDMLDLFEGRLDVVGFTVYPFLEYATVSEIPEDYFQEIGEHTDRPIVITESGWLSEPFSAGSELLIDGSEQEQVDFVLALMNGAESLDVEILMYSFLYEYGGGIDLFRSVALRENAGAAKEAYYYWRALAELPRS